jgi:hypothetical protein
VSWIAAVLALASGQEGLIYETADRDAGAIYLALAGNMPPVSDLLHNYGLGETADAAEIAKALEPFSPVFARLAEAATARRSEWAYSGRDRLAGEIPHVQSSIAAARVLAARTRLRCETGDLDGAVADALVGWRMGFDHVSEGPLINRLVGLVLLALENGALQVGLRGKEPTAAALTRLAVHAEHLVSRFPTFAKSLEGEKRVAVGSIEDAIEDFPRLVSLLGNVGRKPADPPPKDGPGARMWQKLQDLLQRDRAASRRALRERLEEVWKDILAVAERPLGSPGGTDFERIKKRAADRWTGFEKGDDPKLGLDAAADLYVVLVLPAVGRAKETFESGRLALALQALWCRLELHFTTQGRYPDSLEGFRPAIQDPWDGRLLKYRRLDSPERFGFILTASGPEGDADARMRALEEKAGFDADRFSALGKSEERSTGWTVWRVRPR